MLFKPTVVPNASLYDFACVWWNYTLKDWSTFGCSKANHSEDGLRCFCNHTTNFAVLMLLSCPIAATSVRTRERGRSRAMRPPKHDPA
ncbi:adhesion G-protein coupled receptor G7-like [Salvelinus sp. IW2-2015]|uniref:adhesion G-protein coupled receptor G7-like n=1 Tax=Salvelinus sp. IW2-2015 TaxID=2691554 RepID=UPI0038D3DDEC